MHTQKIRKNFIFDKELIDKTSIILKKHNKTFTQIIKNYFIAITKDENIIKQIENQAQKRTGSFIGMLNGKIGNINYNDIKKSYNENIS